MTCDLFLGDRLYSSWSMRGWLAFAAFDIPCNVHMVDLYSGALKQNLRDIAPARTVPAARMADGAVLWDSLAIGEELASQHPNAGLWPAEPRLRATARSLAAEMHSGFSALRAECPMNLLTAFKDTQPSAGVLTDLDRIYEILGHALSQHDGDWLCESYSLADVAFAPVAARIASYDLPAPEFAQTYIANHLSHGPFRRWRAMGLAANSGARPYPKPFAERPWPGPSPLTATISEGPSANSACPYSGRPATHFLTLDGQVYGFCNAFRRDKTLHDPEAWPAFVKLLAGSAGR